LTRIHENLTAKLHFHAGISVEARNRIVLQQGKAMVDNWAAIQEAWGQFDTTLRNGKRVTRQRDVKKAMQSLSDLLGLDDDHDWIKHMYRIVIQSFKTALAEWCMGKTLPSRAEARVAIKAITSTPLFMLMGFLPPSPSRA
jgi:hypothetical protein